MIELQILNVILNDKSMKLVIQHGLSEDHFISYNQEFHFIVEHYDKYGVVPDIPTFLMKFNQFDLMQVGETEQYLIETIREQYMYSQMVPFVNKVSELVTENANRAIDFVREEMERLYRLSIAGYQPGTDIIKNAQERKEEYDLRMAREGLLGITTGIEALDEVLHGWLPGEDFVVIVGRTNEGKSWVVLFFLVVAWLKGMKVLLYSGEMSKMSVGFRFDTLNRHFSNKALMGGIANLGGDNAVISPSEYTKYIDNLKEAENYFIVVTPKDIGGKKMTVPVLNGLIEYYKPDIVGVDQLSLMEDARKSKGDPERIQYTHISEDLYLTSEKYGIPILSPVQANREAAKEKDSEETPQMHQIQESDGIPQNATRIIAMKQIGNTLKLTVRKNRYGEKDKEVLLVWDIDKGIIKPFLAVSTDSTNKKVVDAKPIGAGRAAMGGEELF